MSVKASERRVGLRDVQKRVFKSANASDGRVGLRNVKKGC